MSSFHYINNNTRNIKLLSISYIVFFELKSLYKYSIIHLLTQLEVAGCAYCAMKHFNEDEQDRF